MIPIDFTELARPMIRLTLERDNDRWIARDRDKIYYFSDDFPAVERFAYAFQIRHGAELDHGSIAWCRAQWMLLVTDPFSRRVEHLADVIPFKRGA